VKAVVRSRRKRGTEDVFLKFGKPRQEGNETIRAHKDVEYQEGKKNINGGGGDFK